MVGVTVQ